MDNKFIVNNALLCTKSVKAASKLLKTSERTLWRKIKQYGLDLSRIKLQRTSLSDDDKADILENLFEVVKDNPLRGRPEEVLYYLDGEQYKTHPKYSYIMISNLGRLYNTNINRYLLQTQNDDGYLKISVDGTTKFVHRLVAEAFVANNCTSNNTVEHINGLRTDNRAVNLKWVNMAENITLKYLRYNKHMKFIASLEDILFNNDYSKSYKKDLIFTAVKTHFIRK